MNNADQPAVDGEVIDLDHLIAMAKQIGDFYAPYPLVRASEGMRNHLFTNWDPRMRQAIFDYIDAGGDDLELHVVEAFRKLRDTSEDKNGYYGPPQA
ncbi:MAG: formate dehydrogenase subunit delta [Pseudomonadota bacterium]